MLHCSRMICDLNTGYPLQLSFFLFECKVGTVAGYMLPFEAELAAIFRLRQNVDEAQDKICCLCPAYKLIAAAASRSRWPQCCG